jgi:hypothetical protein
MASLSWNALASEADAKVDIAMYEHGAHSSRNTRRQNVKREYREATELREKIAIFLIARDDGISSEDAEIMWNGWKAAAQEGHRGDCTGEANTCAKCLVDKQYRDADQIFALFKQEIEKLGVIKLKAVPQTIFENQTDTIQTKMCYAAGFKDGTEAQLQDIKDKVRMME